MVWNQFAYFPKLVDPKGIEPSTLSLQGRNASHWNMRAQNVHPKPLSNEEKKMVDRLLCYSDHFSIINVRFSFLFYFFSRKRLTRTATSHPKWLVLANYTTFSYYSRCVRGSNSWAPVWQTGMITTSLTHQLLKETNTYCNVTSVLLFVDVRTHILLHYDSRGD